MSKIRNHAKLLKCYRMIEQYQATKHTAPSMANLVQMGAASSTSVIRHYYRSMQALGMITVIPGIARSVKLLPMPQADSTIKAQANE